MPSNPKKDLEDFASGIYPGALSPQQGSLLPPAAQGGLPFGASPLPPRPPVPGPAFQAPPQALPQAPQAPLPAPMQRAPLMQLGGQAPDVNQMIAERLQSLQRINPARSKYSEAVKYYNALEELPKLTGIANIRSQDRQLQAASLKEIKAVLKKFTDLLPEQQASQRGTFEKLISAHGQLAGMQLSPEDVQHTLKSADIAGMYGELLGGDYTPQERQAIFQQLGSVPANDREKVLGARRAEKDQQLLSLIQSAAPQVIAQMGYSSAKPLDMQTFLNSPQVQQVFDQNSAVKRVFNAYVNDKANAETVAAWGLKPGKIALEKQTKEAAGPELTGEVKNILAKFKGPDGKPLTPATASALPNGVELIRAAEQQAFEQKLEVSKQQGYNAVVAKASAERTVPLIQVQGMQNVHVVNKQTEMPVDRLQTSLEHLQKGGGEAKFAVMDVKAYDAFQSAKEADAILGQYLDLSRALVTSPGANFGQALTMYAKTTLGVDNPGVAFDALRGTLLRMARAMQGSSSQLSNLDAKSVGGMLPSRSEEHTSELQ